MTDARQATTAAVPINLPSYLTRFGLSAFRPGQRDAVETVLSGRDCLCVMPTGGGKSLCYQLPAVVRGGVTLVVSPLIALMKDQVDALTALGIRATFINSTLPPDEQSARLERMAIGQYELVYVVPERFRSPRFLEAVGRCKVGLLAIDEAHCISEWGHDFRPDYAKLGRFRGQLGMPTTIALTATATPKVRRDIVDLLELRDPKSIITGFARPNLRYDVEHQSSHRDKEERLIKFLEETPGAGIVYASSRKRCEEVAQAIGSRTRRGVRVYHAGMSGEDRHAAQDAFMEGRAEIVVATTAFGMGIDKADVRFVVHYNLPGSLEAYYQEAGRAGRDGLPARCLLMFQNADRHIHEFFIETAYPPREIVEKVYDHLCGIEENPIELTQQDLKEILRLPIGSEGVAACEKILEKAGVIERLESIENLARLRLNTDLPTLVDLLPTAAKVKRRVMRAAEQIVGSERGEWVCFQLRDLATRCDMDAAALGRTLRELSSLQAVDYVPPFRGRAILVRERDRPFDSLQIDFETIETRKAAEYERLDTVLRYARTQKCREQQILRYFSAAASDECRNCDNCRQAVGVGHAAQSPKTDEGGLLEVVRIVLSGVARIHGRFGKNVVAQMLWGSTAKKITQFRLDRLSTFGRLRHLTLAEVTTLIDALISSQYIEQNEVNRFRPVVVLTESGTAVMQGRAALDAKLKLPVDLIGKLSRGAATSPETPSHEPSNSRDAAPPVHIETSAPTVAEPTTDDGPRPSHYWTWRLLASGFGPHECAAIRSIPEEVVLDHALRAVDSGWPVRAEWFLSPGLLAQLGRVVGQESQPPIRPLLGQLPQGTRYEHVQLYLKCRPSQPQPQQEVRACAGSKSS